MPVCGVETSERVIALSFDGGPGPYTDMDLQLLRRYGDSASFFVTASRMADFPKAVHEELELGMDVENHTWSHPVMPLLSAASQRAEIEGTQRALEREGAPRPTYWRPPYGAADNQTISIAASLGLRTILWEHAVEITVRFPNPDPRARAEELGAEVRPGQILLAHDSLPLASTTETLQYLLPILRELGYRVVTVPQLLSMGPAVMGHARWGSEVDGHRVMRGGCPTRWPIPSQGTA
jgi:peptidoglycan/xylan/chitin deacetylase (PgdA/CDA1 family)